MRRLAALAAFLVALPAAAQYRETVLVERILLDVRVTDFDGDAIADLTPADFTVTIGGKKAEVLSAEWIDDVSRQVDEPTSRQDELPLDDSSTRRPVDSPPGRLFIFFIQTDWARNATRVTGQMHFLQYAERMIEKTIAPEDRVAVLSFDSHLKFRRDFISDKQDILAAMREALLVDFPPPPPIVPNPSLASRLDRDAMKRAADSEKALLLVANALRPIPGPKTLILMGWGLGHLLPAGVRMKPNWKITYNALDAARVTIFALDTTYADYHDLEAGLKKAANDTGGFYAKTHIWANQAIERLRKTLVGRYELELRRPEGLRPGTHKVDVRVKRRGATVLAPRTWMDRDQQAVGGTR